MNEQPKKPRAFQSPPGKLKLTGKYTPPPAEKPEPEPEPKKVLIHVQHQ